MKNINYKENTKLAHITEYKEKDTVINLLLIELQKNIPEDQFKKYINNFDNLYNYNRNNNNIGVEFKEGNTTVLLMPRPIKSDSVTVTDCGCVGDDTDGLGLSSICQCYGDCHSGYSIDLKKQNVEIIIMGHEPLKDYFEVIGRDKYDKSFYDDYQDGYSLQHEYDRNDAFKKLLEDYRKLKKQPKNNRQQKLQSLTHDTPSTIKI